MAPMKNRHVFTALVLLAAATAAAIGRGVEGSTISDIVGPANAVVFGIVPCSTGNSINVATAPPFANANVQLQCSLLSSLSTPANIAEREEGRRRSHRTGPVVSAAGVTMWANVGTDVNGQFSIALGVITNSSGSGGLLPSMLTADQCSVVITTPLASCNVSLAGVTGTLSAPVRVVGGAINGLLGFAAGPFSFS